MTSKKEPTKKRNLKAQVASTEKAITKEEYLQNEIRTYYDYYFGMLSEFGGNNTRQWEVGDNILATKGDKNKLEAHMFVLHDYLRVKTEFIQLDMMRSGSILAYLYSMCLVFGYDTGLNDDEVKYLEENILGNVNHNIVFVREGDKYDFKDSEMKENFWGMCESRINKNDLVTYHNKLLAQRRQLEAAAEEHKKNLERAARQANDGKNK